MSLSNQPLSIARATPLRELVLPTLPRNISTSYSPHIVPSYLEREHYLSYNSMRRPKIEHRLAKRDPNSLYWAFITDICRAQLPLSTMRQHYKRRWNHAFGAALKANGLDYHGRVRPDVEGVGLKGTLEVKLFGAPCWGDGDLRAMVRHSNVIVAGLLALQRQSEYGYGNGNGYGNKYGSGYGNGNKNGNWKRNGNGNGNGNSRRT